jgi:TonB family protein
MDQLIKSLILIAMTVGVAVTPLSPAEGEQTALRDRYDHARSQSEIRGSNMPGFLIRGDVHIRLKKDSAIDGKYLLAWSPDGRWKEQYAFPGYRRTRIGNLDNFWQVRSTERESAYMLELGGLIGQQRPPAISHEEKLEMTRPENVQGVDAECMFRRSKSNDIRSEYCFDPKTGDLLKSEGPKETAPVAWMIPRKEYSNFQVWNQKRIPKTMKGFNGKATVLEVEIQTIEPLPALPPDYFTPPKEASVWMECTDGSAWKLHDHAVPEYSHSARLQGRQGTVTLYAVIGEDGKIAELSIANSAWPELDESALRAVALWRYERSASCASATGRSETLIDVIFSLH